ADARPEGEATGSEWRTPPLWGIGLTETVSGHTLFLHDGRARNLTEAILWHGGEGGGARDKFADLPEAQRDARLCCGTALGAATRAARDPPPPLQGGVVSSPSLAVRRVRGEQPRLSC